MARYDVPIPGQQPSHLASYCADGGSRVSDGLHIHRFPFDYRASAGDDPVAHRLGAERLLVPANSLSWGRHLADVVCILPLRVLTHPFCVSGSVIIPAGSSSWPWGRHAGDLLSNCPASCTTFDCSGIGSGAHGNTQ